MNQAKRKYVKEFIQMIEKTDESKIEIQREDYHLYKNDCLAFLKKNISSNLEGLTNWFDNFLYRILAEYNNFEDNATKDVINLLKTNEHRFRIFILKLGETKNTSFHDLLLDILETRNEYHIINTTIETIGNIGYYHKDIAQHLLRLISLKDSKHISTIATTLGKIGAKESYKVLKNLNKNKSENDLWSVDFGLAYLNDKQVINKILRSAKDHKHGTSILVLDILDKLSLKNDDVFIILEKTILDTKFSSERGDVKKRIFACQVYRKLDETRFVSFFISMIHKIPRNLKKNLIDQVAKASKEIVLPKLEKIFSETDEFETKKVIIEIITKIDSTDEFFVSIIENVSKNSDAYLELIKGFGEKNNREALPFLLAEIENCGNNLEKYARLYNYKHQCNSFFDSIIRMSKEIGDVKNYLLQTTSNKKLDFRNRTAIAIVNLYVDNQNDEILEILKEAHEKDQGHVWINWCLLEIHKIKSRTIDEKKSIDKYLSKLNDLIDEKFQGKIPEECFDYHFWDDKQDIIDVLGKLVEYDAREVIPYLEEFLDRVYDDEANYGKVEILKLIRKMANSGLHFLADLNDRLWNSYEHFETSSSFMYKYSEELLETILIIDKSKKESNDILVSTLGIINSNCTHEAYQLEFDVKSNKSLDAEIGLKVINEMIKRKDPMFWEILVETLKGSIEILMHRAVEALGEIGGNDVISLLIRLSWQTVAHNYNYYAEWADESISETNSLILSNIAKTSLKKLKIKDYTPYLRLVLTDIIDIDCNAGRFDYNFENIENAVKHLSNKIYRKETLNILDEWYKEIDNSEVQENIEWLKRKINANIGKTKQD